MCAHLCLLPRSVQAQVLFFVSFREFLEFLAGHYVMKHLIPTGPPTWYAQPMTGSYAKSYTHGAW